MIDGVDDGVTSEVTDERYIIGEEMWGLSIRDGKVVDEGVSWTVREQGTT